MKADIAFSNDDAHRLLPWVVGIMAALATLMLCLGLSVGHWMTDQKSSVSGNFTVNIPSSTDNLDKKLPQVTEALLKTDGVDNVSQLSAETLKSLLTPWFGNSDIVGELPLPVVLDIRVKSNAKPDLKLLQTNLSAIVSGIEIDSREGWTESFLQFSLGLRALLTLLAVVVLGGLALIITFMSRAAMKLHARSVQLLHSIGAEDSYITRQFQSEAGMLTLKGTVPGCLMGGAIYWGVGQYLASLKSALPPLSITPEHLMLLGGTPLICSLIAWGTARFSVLQQLKKTL